MTQAESIDRRRSLQQVTFVLLLVASIGAYCLLIWRQLHYGLEMDEAYHFNVVRNIAEGRGYIDDGVSFDSTGTAFTPEISAGPTLLLPSALVWRLSGGSLEITRLAPLAFFVVYLLSVAALFRRWGGRWPALAAASAPLLIAIASPDLYNRTLMPGRFVSESAAAGGLALAAYLVSRRWFLWSGLAAGLAIQAKFNFALPAVVLLLTVVVGYWIFHRSDIWHVVWRYSLGAALPTLAFEAWVFITLGGSGYVQRRELTANFYDLQTNSLDQVWSSLGSKLGAVGHLLSLPALLLLVMLILGLGFVLLRGRDRAPEDASIDRTPTIAVAALGLAALSNLLWWLMISAQGSSRPAVPSVMILLSVLTGVVVRSLQLAIRRSHGRQRQYASVLAAATVGALLVGVVYQGFAWLRNDSGDELLADQRVAAHVIAGASDAVPVDSFWTNTEMTALTGLPTEKYQLERTRLLVFTSLRADVERGQPDATLYLDRCGGGVLFRSRHVVVCWPPP